METITKQIEQVAEVAGYLWQKGWAERNGGNIVINVTDQFAGQLPTDNCQLSTPIAIGTTLPHLIILWYDSLMKAERLPKKTILDDRIKQYYTSSSESMNSKLFP